MKTYSRSIFSILVFAFVFPFLATAQTSKNKETTLFPKGQKAPAGNFVGTVWVENLVGVDSVYTLASGSVTFEPGARTNWHLHPSGQILLVTEGTGYHQIKGQPKQIIHKGDVIKCLPNVAHWHGASATSSMTHIHIVPNTEKGIVEWLEPVTEAEYQK